ncbi:MAG: hypothetical protein NVSMB32_12390 [Actinomycetota bacterium]
MRGNLPVTGETAARVGSLLAATLDEAVAAFGNRPLDAGPYTCVWLDAFVDQGP